MATSIDSAPRSAALRADPASGAAVGTAPAEPDRPWLTEWAKLTAAAGLTVLVSFLLWEVVERQYATDVDTAFVVHYVRGISTSLAAASVVGLLSYRQHLRRVAGLRTEIADATRDLVEARAFLQLVFDATPAALLVLDGDYNVVKANRAAELLHGLKVAGRRCHDALVGSAERCEQCPAAETFASGRTAELTGVHADPRTGEILAVQSHRLELPGGERFVLLVETSVTAQKKLEARLIHQEKMAAFGLLAAGIAHDMGNPLSSIAAQVQLLDDDQLPADVRGVVATVREETERLRRILRELVDFARRRRDEASLVSIQAVVSDALRLIRHERRMRQIRVIEDFDRETPPVFLVEDHLMQVILNLVINALDAMPEGGELRIEVRPAGERVVLRIRDNGVGMDRATLDRCFEPLFTTKELGRGTGLGLSISRDILEAAGGRIELHSAPGQGTTAVVVLPAATDDEDGPT